MDFKAKKTELLERLSRMNAQLAEMQLKIPIEIIVASGNKTNQAASKEKNGEEYFCKIKQIYTNLWEIQEDIRAGQIKQKKCDAYFANQCELLKASDGDFEEKQGLLEIAVSNGYSIEYLQKVYAQTPLLKSCSIASSV
jgi:hypothetical protein